MKKLLKSKILWALLVIIIIGGIVGWKLLTPEATIEYVTAEVVRGDVVQTVEATGKIKSASEIKLNFKNAGQLSLLKVKIGDQVKKDQILAQLKASDLLINVNKARANLNEALANLNKIKAGATTQEIAIYEATVKKYQTDLANAQADQQNIQAVYGQTLENQENSTLNDLNANLTKANISLQRVYDTINYKGDAANLTSSNSVLKQKVQSDYQTAVSKVDESELSYNMAKLDPIDSKINDAVEKTLIALNKTLQTLDDLSALLDSVIVNSNITQTELDTLKTTANTERVTISTGITAVQTSKQSLADAKLNYQTKVDSAKNAVKVAQDNLAKSQADLQNVQAPARSEDISLYNAQVSRAQADLQLAQDKYDETIIRAPIDGVITDVNFDVGEQTNLTEPAIVMLAVENFEIEVDIPESDIVKLNIGDETDITLDAFTDQDYIFKGSVTTINPAQTEIQDVIYYRVTAAFLEAQPANVKDLMAKIKPGMTANVTIQTAMVSDVLVAPYRAVKEQAGKKIVEILQFDNTIKEKEVILGLRGDEGLVEIISGLELGDKVVTFVRQ
ncbi:MAG: efflux RND transporter periplasmic adaptor subunit [Patescibacteria group bacterium]|jgi:HlyD family secretion protein|nr:efflux RND transporter periplasmic adaptor subunit [Patescibacteria group bacterium]